MQHGLQQDGGIGACQRIRKKEQNQFLLIKISLKSLVGKASLYTYFQYESTVYELEVSRHFWTYEDLIQFNLYVNFVNFSCMTFWAQNVLIPPNHILLKCARHDETLLLQLQTIIFYLNHGHIVRCYRVLQYSGKITVKKRNTS